MAVTGGIEPPRAVYHLAKIALDPTDQGLRIEALDGSRPQDSGQQGRADLLPETRPEGQYRIDPPEQGETHPERPISAQDHPENRGQEYAQCEGEQGTDPEFRQVPQGCEGERATHDQDHQAE